MTVPSCYTLHLHTLMLLFYIWPFKAQQQLLYVPCGVTLNKQILHFVHVEILCVSHYCQRSRDTSVCVVTRLRSGQPRILGWFPAGVRDFSLLQNIQTFSRTHPVSYLMGTEGTVSWRKQPFGEANHAPLSCAKVKNAWPYWMVCTRTLFLKLFGK
jgi:hypothetical protein